MLAETQLEALSPLGIGHGRSRRRDEKLCDAVTMSACLTAE
jgi:hypothetical protein